MFSVALIGLLANLASMYVLRGSHDLNIRGAFLHVMGDTLSSVAVIAAAVWIAITGTAARAITWGTSFEASTVALPTTTVSTNRLDVGFVWNAATSKWRCVAVA